MRAARALTLLSIVGFAVTGCASAKKLVSGATTVTGTTTISNVKTGTLITCKGGTGAKVPPRGQGVAGSTARQAATPTTTGPRLSAEIQVMHRLNGSVTVSCRSS